MKSPSKRLEEYYKSSDVIQVREEYQKAVDKRNHDYAETFFRPIIDKMIELLTIQFWESYSDHGQGD